VTRAGLLVIDMQRGFMEPTLPGIPYLEDSAQVRAVSERLLRAARESGLGIVFSKHSMHVDGSDVPVWLKDQIPPGWMIQGTEATEIWPTLAPAPDEPVVVKNRFDAFLHTDLDQVLRLRGIDHLLVCGILTNFCVETTAKSAMQRDYKVTVLSDATDAMSPNIHFQALEALRTYAIDVRTTAEFFDGGTLSGVQPSACVGSV